MFVPVNQVNAQSMQDTLTFQLIWVTSNKSCYHNDVQRMNEYNEITKLYLSAYGLEYLYYNPACMTLEDYESYQLLEYTDLLIVVYEKSTGREILHEKNIGGFFQSAKTNSPLRIEVCECPSFIYGNPVWVLSHELSHFALFYLGFEERSWVYHVHYKQSAYNQYCPEGDTTIHPRICQSLYTVIEGYNTEYKVMAIHPYAHSATPPHAKFGTTSSQIPSPILSSDQIKLGIHDLDTHYYEIEQGEWLTIIVRMRDAHGPIADKVVDIYDKTNKKTLKIMLTDNNGELSYPPDHMINEPGIHEIIAYSWDRNDNRISSNVILINVIESLKPFENIEFEFDVLTSPDADNYVEPIVNIDSSIYDLREETNKIILKLEKAIITSEKSLSGLQYEKQEAIDKINQAWNLLKESKYHLDHLKDNLQKGDTILEEQVLTGEHQDYLGIVEKLYTVDKWLTESIDKNLAEIPKLISEAKEIENKGKFCFLWFFCIHGNDNLSEDDLREPDLRYTEPRQIMI